jgi:hypothetical protein
LLHELRVRAVVDNTLAKNRGGERGVDIFGANIAKLGIEDKLIALRSDVYRGLLAEENEGKAVAVLFQRRLVSTDSDAPRACNG